ncbi:MAG TPA: LpqB family beta-propeller domain-containing protein, partial [Terriglobales bacterium]|nr:LpqB family beta-propeller domain-containing protein [Terriglobales bacterium]
MPLPPGTSLGKYRIVSLVGTGGMGEVYRAQDPQLQREVAIKVLPESLSADPERTQRFQREARMAAALHHPNILAIFDVGVQDARPYLVTELLKGESLREAVQRRALSPRKAVDIARQVALGLAAAHDQGIVHRDLKPENIFLCSDGSAKVLDFGIAKLIAGGPAAGDAQTLTGGGSLTREGEIVGTVTYMSPEQLRGAKLDSRSDIFSFGAVVYEMLAGQRAFGGDSGAEIASAILKDDPRDLRALQPAVSPSLQALVHRCLEKDPAHRFQSARDLAFQLANIDLASTTTSRVETLRRLRWHWPAAALLLLVLAAAAAWWWRPRPTLNSVAYQRLTDFAGLEEAPALSPDGKSVAFVADVTGTRQIWVRLLAGGPPLQVTHDGGAHLDPRWSQDSASLFFFVPPTQPGSEGTIAQISALGGAPRRLVSALSGPDISHDGRRLSFFRLTQDRVELVTSELDGSGVQVVTQFPARCCYGHVRWSPDDRILAFQHNSGIWSDNVYTVGSAGGAVRRLTPESQLMAGLAWLPNGKGIVYSAGRGAILYLPPMQLSVSLLDGSPPRRLTYGDASYEGPDIDRAGRLVASRRAITFDIWKYPVAGSPQENVARGLRITHQTGTVQTPTLSPDNREMAYLSDSGGRGNVWVMNLQTGATRQITSEGADTTIGVPVWSPDGAHIIFAASKREGPNWPATSYWMVQPDGSDLRDFLPNTSWAAWSADARWIYFSTGVQTSQGIEDL